MKNIVLIVVAGLILFVAVPIMIVYAYNGGWKFADLKIETILVGYTSILYIVESFATSVWLYKKKKLDDCKKSIPILLSDSLRNLDVGIFSNMIEYVDKYKNNVITSRITSRKKIMEFISPETISSLIEKANRNKFLERQIPSIERGFFRGVLTDLDNFTKDYQSLLREWNKKELGKQCLDEEDLYVGQLLKKSIDLCRRYKVLETAVSETLDKFEHR